MGVRQVEDHHRNTGYEGEAMTIKPEVLAAIKSRDNGFLNDADWQTIRAELLAMDAEITELRTNHAEIADAVKDARRYRWLKKNDNAYLLAEDVIDDAMHNSAREVGDELADD